jgi:hypothetical protein
LRCKSLLDTTGIVSDRVAASPLFAYLSDFVTSGRPLETNGTTTCTKSSADRIALNGSVAAVDRHIHSSGFKRIPFQARWTLSIM